MAQCVWLKGAYPGTVWLGQLTVYSPYVLQVPKPTLKMGSPVAWWLMPRTPDREIGGSSPTRVTPCCVLEQGIFTPQIPRKRWLRPNMTEKLFTGTLRINQSTNLENNMFVCCLVFTDPNFSGLLGIGRKLFFTFFFEKSRYFQVKLLEVQLFFLSKKAIG